MAISSINNRQQGMSLIGVLVATFILVGGVLAVVQLMARTESVVNVSQEQFVATNLAREGLELVRTYRDTNWLTANSVNPPIPPRAWNQDLCGPITIESDSSGSLFVRQNPSVADQKLFLTPSGFWTHLSAGNKATPYSSVVTIVPMSISEDTGNIEQVDTCQAANILEVTSRVYWQSRGGATESVIKEKLYDWYQKT